MPAKRRTWRRYRKNVRSSNSPRLNGRRSIPDIAAPGAAFARRVYCNKNYLGVKDKQLADGQLTRVARARRPVRGGALREIIRRGPNIESYAERPPNRASRNRLRVFPPLRKIPPGQEGVEPVPKEKPKVNIGEVIRSYRGQRGLSQGDIERRTGLLRCYLSRVENGHTVPSLETLAKIAEAMEIALADFFPGAETPRDRDTQKMLGELSEDEIRFLSEIKRYSSTLSDGDKRLVLAMIRKMASMITPPNQQRKLANRRTA